MQSEMPKYLPVLAASCINGWGKEFVIIYQPSKQSNKNIWALFAWSESEEEGYGSVAPGALLNMSADNSFFSLFVHP